MFYDTTLHKTFYTLYDSDVIPEQLTQILKFQVMCCLILFSSLCSIPFSIFYFWLCNALPFEMSPNFMQTMASSWLSVPF